MSYNIEDRHVTYIICVLAVRLLFNWSHILARGLLQLFVYLRERAKLPICECGCLMLLVDVKLWSIFSTDLLKRSLRSRWLASLRTRNRSTQVSFNFRLFYFVIVVWLLGTFGIICIRAGNGSMGHGSWVKWVAKIGWVTWVMGH